MFRNVRMSPATAKSRKTRMALIICEAPIPFATLRLSPKIVNEKNHSFTHITGGNLDRKTQEIQRKNTLSIFFVFFICRWLRLLASQHQMRTNAKYKYEMRIQDKYKINDLFTSLPVARSPPNSSPSNTRHRISRPPVPVFSQMLDIWDTCRSKYMFQGWQIKSLSWIVFDI